MVSDDYFVLWGKDALTTWPAEALANIRISDASKAFLLNVGMPPTKSIVGLDYTWDLALPAFGAGRRVLGRYHSTPLLIDELAGGCVIWPRLPSLPGSTRAWSAERWYNSSVEQYAMFLTAFRRFFTALVRTDAAFDALEEELTRIDPPAVDPNGPWGVLLLEERTGVTD